MRAVSFTTSCMAYHPDALANAGNESAVGYSEESLRMLRTAEGQTNAVFACYGSAAQRAQNFEDGLVKFLLVFNRMAETAVRLEDLECAEADLRRRTMGQLTRQLSKRITFTSGTPQPYFEAALESRNFLMHRFFLERHEHLKTEKGRFQLLRELVTMEQIFDRARIAINAMRIALCRELGFEPGDNA